MGNEDFASEEISINPESVMYNDLTEGRVRTGSGNSSSLQPVSLNSSKESSFDIDRFLISIKKLALMESVFRLLALIIGNALSWLPSKFKTSN